MKKTNRHRRWAWLCWALLAFGVNYHASAGTNRVGNGLLVLYRFDEGSGSTVTDSAGSTPLNLSIADTNAVTWLPDGGLHVQSPTVIASITAADKITSAGRTNNQFTVEAWVAPDAGPQSGRAALWNIGTASNALNVDVSQNADRYALRLRHNATNETGELYVSADAVTLPFLHHVVVTRDAGGWIRFYVNGEASGVSFAGNTLANWSDGIPLRLVNDADGTVPWSGELHLVAGYNRALSATEINQNYLAGPRPGRPIIVRDPQDTTVEEPDLANFSVLAYGPTPLTYTWRKNGANQVVSGSSYVYGPTSLADSGSEFDVVISNAFGVVTSQVAVLTVNPFEPDPPSITTQPQDVSVVESNAASFLVEAAGDGTLAYQWRRDGTNISGAINAIYTLDPALLADDGATFDVTVSSEYGSVTSQVATLTVEPFVPEPPSITQQPADKSVVEPNGASFNVAAAGTAPLAYQWRRDGTPIDGATSTGYSLSSTDAAADDGARFDVVVSNPYGVVTSRLATLTVDVFVGDPPAITQEPADQSVVEPNGATFTVTATGTDPLSYQWRRDGLAINGATSSSFTLSPTDHALDDGAVFDVVVSNPYGTATSRGALLSVAEYVPPPPTIQTQPADVQVTEPAPATFTVSASGEGTLTYQWRRDGSAIGGATLDYYTLDPTDAAVDDGAQFDVIVSSEYGSVTSTVATLTVEADVPQPPAIETEPQDITVPEPQGAGFSVIVSGDDPIAYQWQRNGTPISGATKSAYALAETDYLVDDGAQFRVVVSNPYGAVTSRVATLTVTTTSTAPTIDVEPADVTVTEPDPAAFAVTVSGDTPYAYQWRRNGTVLAGEASSVLSIDPTATASDNGAQFDVIVSNPYGSVTSRIATLTVEAPPQNPPVIETQPADAAVTAPAPVAFGVTVSGDAPFSYQWRRDGTPIGGATKSAYSLASTSLSDNGAGFDVIVANAYGSVTSRTAVLTVELANLNPPQLDPIDDRSVRAGSLLTVAVSADDADGTVPALAAPAAPAGASFTDAGDGTGSFTWTPAVGDVGDHTVQITASDGLYTVTNRFVVTVASFGLTAPTAGSTVRLADRLLVQWTGAAPLGSVTIDLWKGQTLVRTLGSGLPANNPSGTRRLMLPATLPIGSDYWVSVMDDGNPDDVAWSPTFTVRRRRLLNDFDNDGISDLAVMDANTGYWYIRRARSDQVITWAQQWGWPGANPVPGDYDNDGQGDLAVFDNNGGNWYARPIAGNPTIWAEQWGWPGAKPVPGDYNGNGRYDLAVFDTNTGRWYIRDPNGETIVWNANWGWPGAVPVPGDYDGDDKADMAVFDSNTGYWYIRTASGTTIAWQKGWGWPGAVPVPGDYNGDGKSDLAVFDSNTGYWYVTPVTGDPIVWAMQWGWPGANPVSGDFNGDGRYDMAIFDANTGLWYIRPPFDGNPYVWAENWGWPGARAQASD